ncbi:20S proteasome subunit [Rhizoctonia solani]|uniref:20S proteasome subunit n=1 Tax=Rhizoctonia solani TaxID=456999 RepID=A0A8H8SWA2_9AGAM|nr:20S proteasome subunit [Rhizoctonia solani]QRW18988.1 20S proteasome subunit [Rhizoctonia solani]
MSAAGGGGAYSFSLTTFSPSGKLVQIEHALAVVAQGTTSLGIKATNGIVIATEKKSSSILVDESAIDKVCVICPNIGIVYSGMGPDYRVLTAKARKSAQAYWKMYGEYPPTRVLVQSIATVMQEATQSGGVRPFGVSLLVAGWDSHRGPTLYQVDPSGSFWAWKASAIGKNMTNAKTFLEKRYNDDISLEDAIHTALLTLKEGFEGQMTEKTIEIGVVTIPTAEELAEVPVGGERVKPVFRKLTEEQVAHRTPTIRSRSIRSGTSEPPKPKVPVSLARRLLFPNLPPTTPLPPILTLGLSEDDPTLVELNKELYDFLALALRAFVQVWWGQITPRDRDLIPQITRVIIHVIQDIEQRASSVDLSNLVLHQIPTLVDLHVNDYRVAAMRMGTAFTNTSPSPTIAGLFHMLQPHVAIQTNQEVGTPIISEVYLRQLVENILKLSLPPEDWESETERCIVREILACVVLGNVFKKLAQPWFLHQIILGLLKPPSIQPERPPRITILKALKVLLTVPCTFGPGFGDIRLIGHANNIQSGPNRHLYIPIYYDIDPCRESQSRTAKATQRKDTSESIMSLSSSLEGKIETPTEIIPEDMANEDILLPSLKLVGDLIQVEDRLPINTVLLLLRLSSRLCQPWLEKLIPFMLYRIISPISLIGAIQAGKRALFPNDGWPGPAPAEPTIEEQLLCASNWRVA